MPSVELKLYAVGRRQVLDDQAGVVGCRLKLYAVGRRRRVSAFADKE